MKTNRTLLLAMFMASAISPGLLLAQTTDRTDYPRASSHRSDLSPRQLAQATTTTDTTTPKTTSTTTPASTDEEVIQLSPFVVSSEKDNGYATTETLAGTRIRTDLADVGASIEVVNKQFLQDVGAVDTQTLLQYTTNTQVAGPRGTYGGMGNSTAVDESGNLISPQGAQRVRGLAAADVARDFYISDIPWDSFNVDRIDILRGPNSILYGLGSPAGIINASTHNAEFRNMGNFEVRTGSYGTIRSSVDVNQQVIPDVLAIRVDGLLSNKKFEQESAFENDKRLYGAIRFDPQLFRDRSFNTSIRVKVEHGEINANRPRTVPPMDSVTPWWNPVATSASNPFGGMGKNVVGTVYDPNRTDDAGVALGYGQDRSTTPNFLPWLAGQQVQQPFFFIDGSTNRLDSATAGFINNAWRDSSGNVLPVSSGIAGLRQFVPFYSVGDFAGSVVRAHAANASVFPDAGYGQYRQMSLLDPSVYDFYNYLIDGPNARETDSWNAQNFDVQQTAFDNRLGLDLSYDHQHRSWGGWSLLGWQPRISIDITQNGEDYYTHPSTTNVTNPNYGRPFVYGAGGSGGSIYTSDRKYMRASLFGELRGSDVTSNKFLQKLLGKQRLNGVMADEKYFYESRGYQLYANSTAFQGFWNGNDGSSVLWYDRAPVAVIYLGPSVISKSSPSGLNIPNIKTNITLPDTSVRLFDSTWQNYAVNFSDPWNVPTSMSRVFSGIPNDGSTTQLYQNSNPANYVGWRGYEDDLLRYNNGADKTLTTSAQKSLRETISDSASYQGYFWNNAVIATLGWRYDEVKSKSIVAQKTGANRQVLNLDPNTYTLPSTWDGDFKGHSTSGGLVVHINRLLPRDFLPVNVSVSYNESSNFQVSSARTDIYGNLIGNPTGKTYEYGLQLATKDNKVSLRVAKYTTKLSNGTSTLANSYQLGGVVATGLTWRNIFLYQMGSYDWGSRNQPSYRNTWTTAYPLANTSPNLMGRTNYTQTQADADEDNMIDTWNDIQKTLAAKGFFKAWNFTPTTDSVLVNRTTFLSNPSQYSPDPTTIANYAANSATFAVTSDTQSKGYEYELTANPTSHWRISFNASETTATETNVGGAALTDYINYMNGKLINADGTLTPAGALPRYGGAGNSIYPSIWGPFLANYTLLKLNEGSAVPELRKWRYNIISNYSFHQSFLKGLGVGGSYHWEDKVVLGYPVVTGGSFASYDLTKPYYGPALNALDLWLSYERKLTKNVRWRIALNVYNVGKKDKLIPISIEPDGHTWASARTAPVEQWMLTNTFSF